VLPFTTLKTIGTKDKIDNIANSIAACLRNEKKR
jgi:hypothetical protein